LEFKTWKGKKKALSSKNTNLKQPKSQNNQNIYKYTHPCIHRMVDIFENRILCKKCNKEMKSGLVSRNGFNLRAIKCEKCGETALHPQDESEYQEFMRLKKKEYEVKMRMVGNSYAVSIPREIVDFMKEQENMINNMVRLSFENAGRLSLNFNMPEQESEGIKSRTVSSKEVKIMRNGKVFHAKQFSDSANPKNNNNLILRNDLNDEEE